MRRRRKGADVDKPYGLAKRSITRWVRNDLKLNLRLQLVDYQTANKNGEDASTTEDSHETRG